MRTTTTQVRGMKVATGLVASGLGGAIAYWIYKNYWHKSFWGKVGVAIFGLGATTNIIRTTGYLTAPAEYIQSEIEETQTQKSSLKENSVEL